MAYNVSCIGVMNLSNIDRKISKRILYLAGCIASLFVVIFLRLVYIQVFEHDSYTEKKNEYTSIIQYTSAPRGQILDRNGKILAKTVVAHNIVYTAPQNVTSEDTLLYAKRIVSVFDLDEKSLTDQDKKEGYLAYLSLLPASDPHYQGNDLLTASQKQAISRSSNPESVRTQYLYKAIGKKQWSTLSKKELKTYVVYQRMTQYSSTGQANVILADVSEQDVTYLVENKSSFPGFDVDFGGWKREYPYGEALSDVLGKVSTSTEGLPEQYLTYYLQRGFSRNAMVGKSGLEFVYNDVLSGTAQQSLITYDSKGMAHSKVVRQGVRGNDVYLSIDIDLQVKLDNILKNILEEKGGSTNREKFASLFTVVNNPQTGELLAMSGYQKDLKTKRMTYYASGNYNSLVNPGSAIKGATIYMAESEGAIKPGQTFNDEPININGEEFASFKNHGVVDDVQALAVSSNVYMFYSAIALAHGVYTEGKPLVIPDYRKTMDTMRHYFTMFGLGNKTGLDVPDEIDGYQGASQLAGMILNYSIGQFDMYTPLQLLVYDSTIANGGYVYRPTLMKEVREVNSLQVIDQPKNTLLSVLPEKNKTYLNRVREGFRQVVAQGNASTTLADYDIPVSGKTGTAEVENWTTANFVGYAPSDQPEIAFACSAPLSSVNDETVAPNICSSEVAPKLVQAYFGK